MRRVGIALIVIGLLIGVAAMSMDVTVTTEAQTIAGVEIPSQTVNNIGLMDERRNYLIIAGFVATGGLVLTALGRQPTESRVADRPPLATRTCPFCAEEIKPSAIVCRFCGRDLPAASDGPADTTYPATEQMQEAIMDLRWQYDAWITRVEDGSSLSAATEAAGMLDTLEAIAKHVATEDSTTRWNVARKLREDFPAMLDHEDLGAAIIRIESTGGAAPA